MASRKLEGVMWSELHLGKLLLLGGEGVFCLPTPQGPRAAAAEEVKRLLHHQSRWECKLVLVGSVRSGWN